MTEDRTQTQSAPQGVARRQRVLAFWPGGSASRDLPERGKVTFGRSVECDVQIEHPSVSRQHAAIHVGPPVAVEDLASSNGTRLSGRRLEARRPEAIRAGQFVEMGLATVVVQAADGAAAGGPLPRPTDAASSTLAPRASTMDRLWELVDMIAAGRLSVVVRGETGVGKEVVTSAIHARSPRASRPLVRLNCASLPEHLLESELFGFERGAFTGATQAKPGLIEVADGGTLVLDEVAELPPAVQAKLLRVLENREVLRLGALTPRTVDVRFLSATHRDLETMVAEQRFRADLYYRLDGITITIPPLRERLDEIPALTEAFVRDASAHLGRPPQPPSAEVLAILRSHTWPGNVRELRNVVERAVTLAGGGPIEPRHLAMGPSLAPPPSVRPAPASATTPASVAPASAAPASAPGDLRHEVEELERRRILEALERSGGNQGEAAKLLNISRRTLISRLDAYRLPRPRKGRA